MKSISAVELSMVTGGKLDASLGTTGATTGLTGSGNNDAVLTALTGIQASLKDVNKNQGLFSGPNGWVPAMVLGMALSGRGGGSNNHVSYSYNSGGYYPAGGHFRFRVHGWG